MLAQAGEPFDSPKHLFEIKWDGTRCLAFIEADRIRLQNRRFIEMRERYPELAILRNLPPGTVIDGEIVVLEEGKPSFNKLQQREHLLDPSRISMLSERMPATLIVFDLLYLSYGSWMGRPLTDRREQASKLVHRLDSPHVLAPDHIIEYGTAYFAEVERHGLEGIMAKRLDSPYLPGKRSSHWLKIKVAQTGEFDIVGYTRREAEPVVSALLLGMQYRGRLIYKGKVGSGFTEDQRRELFVHLSTRPELNTLPKNGPKDAVWRATELRCAVRFFEKTKTGMLRAPVFKGLIEQ